MKWLSLLLFTFASAAQNSAPKMPLVFISGNGSTTITASGVAIGPFSGGSASASKHDQTMEMAENLLKKCPEISIIVERSERAPDYELFLNRETAGWFNEGVSQILLVRSSDHAVLYATKKGTVAKAVKEGCRAIIADWKQRRPADGWWQPAPQAKP